ncbi:MAG: cytochrome C, partial [Acidobacteriota bacterium]
MRRILLALLALAAIAGLAFTALRRNSSEPTPLQALKARTAKPSKSSVDHSLFAQLKAPFKRPQDVTAACLSCHNGRQTE